MSDAWGFYNRSFWQINFPLPLLDCDENEAAKLVTEINLKIGWRSLKREFVMKGI